MLDSTLYPRLYKQFELLIRESCDLNLVKMDPLPGDASRRKYFRLYHNDGTLIGVSGNDEKENRSFIYFCRHFHSMGLPVPQLYASNMGQGIYVVEDLGDETLAERTSKPSVSRKEVLHFYVQSVKDLVDFQVLGHMGIDYKNNCHQNQRFDQNNAEEDLQYFSENFFLVAKDYSNISGIEFELKKLAEIVGNSQPTFFLYRDFQCRNMIVRSDGRLGYVDFQAGRQGPLQYDVATLLYASQAHLSESERQNILLEYLNKLKQVTTPENTLKEEVDTSDLSKAVSHNDFMSKYYFFVLFRILRALGVYLFLANREGHRRFFGAVPLALENLAGLFSEHMFLGEVFPMLQALAKRLSSEETFLHPNKLMKLIGPH
ncbi:MAG: phosphotransferase [Thermodesulfobacteriota bacterium]|nr:phosphotransferase [Thermodesulfobacteriota bacterium]